MSYRERVVSDWRDNWLIVLLWVAVNIFDLMTTAFNHSLGGQEVNPVLLAFGADTAQEIGIAKIIGVTVCVGLLAVANRLSWLFWLILVCYGVGWFNVLNCW